MILLMPWVVKWWKNLLMCWLLFSRIFLEIFVNLPNLIPFTKTLCCMLKIGNWESIGSMMSCCLHGEIELTFRWMLWDINYWGKIMTLNGLGTSAWRACMPHQRWKTILRHTSKHVLCANKINSRWRKILGYYSPYPFWKSLFSQYRWISFLVFRYGWDGFYLYCCWQILKVWDLYCVSKYPTDDADLFMKYAVKYFGIPKDNISDRDT